MKIARKRAVGAEVHIPMIIAIEEQFVETHIVKALRQFGWENGVAVFLVKEIARNG
jgi:hypothetical protein